MTWLLEFQHTVCVSYWFIISCVWWYFFFFLSLSLCWVGISSHLRPSPFPTPNHFSKKPHLPFLKWNKIKNPHTAFRFSRSYTIPKINFTWTSPSARGHPRVTSALDTRWIYKSLYVKIFIFHITHRYLFWVYKSLYVNFLSRVTSRWKQLHFITV